MNQIELQAIFESAEQPGLQQIQSWVDAALDDFDKDTEVVVRIVGELESAQLNKRYRHKSGPTNILSFPIDLPDGIELNLLGDLVICAPLVATEALEQNKLLLDHWAHIIVHGVLHLLGYDHLGDDEAELMENKEIAILNLLNINNPYTEANNQ